MSLGSKPGKSFEACGLWALGLATRLANSVRKSTQFGTVSCAIPPTPAGSRPVLASVRGIYKTSRKLRGPSAESHKM